MPLAAVAALAGTSAFAGAWDNGNTWFVATNGVDTAASAGGGTEAAPFRTLQFAHDQAAKGDTIRVAPGVYDEGGKVGAVNTSQMNRLVVTKKLRFVATGGKEVTHVVGRLDPDSLAAGGPGWGPAGVRCVCVQVEGHGSAFEGFTFRNGGGPDSSASDSRYAKSGFGGAIVVDGDASAAPDAAVKKAYFTDCVISNSAACWGGGMRGGTAIRCLVAGCHGSSFGQAVCSASMWNCVVAGTTRSDNSDARPAVGNNSVLVNCTVSGNAQQGAGRYVRIYNGVFSQNGSTDMSPSYSPAPIYTNCVGTADQRHSLLSPATGDVRPLAGSKVIGAGETCFLTNGVVVLPEGTEMTDYYGRPLDLTRPRCNAGAAQGSGVAPAGGGIELSAAAVVDGWRNGSWSYTFAETWPVVRRIVPTSAKFLRYSLKPDLGGLPCRYPQEDGIVWQMPPPNPDQVVTNTATAYSVELWTDPDADEATQDGSREHPYATLQAAMDHVNAKGGSGTVTIVRALPGVYSNGCATAEGRNRLVIPNNRPVVIKSVAGAARTTIIGEADDEGLYPDVYVGCGPKAMRCIYVNGNDQHRAIQGFTIANGHSNCTDPNEDVHADRVGGIWGCSSALKFQVLDCVITNCTALRGGACYYTAPVRTRFYDCHAFGGVTRYASLSGCFVDGSCTTGKGAPGATGNQVLGTSTYSYFSTVIDGTTATSKHQHDLFTTTAVGKNGTYWGSVFEAPSSVGAGAVGYAVADPCFIDPAAGDYRLFAATPAWDAARQPERGTDAWDAWAKDFAGFASGGVGGQPNLLRNGTALPGGFQTVVGEGVYVADAAGALVVSGGKRGYNPLADDLCLTVSASPELTRPCAGVLINGVTNLFGGARSVILTAEDVRAAGGAVTVVPLLTSDWYVNPDPSVGDDAQDGFTPQTAKRTLAAAMEAAASGDTVHAAPGVYAEGSMGLGSDDPSVVLQSRVVVKSGVTLEGAGDASVIEGAADPDASADDWGLGTNALRCVYLAPNARIRRFTLRNGCTRTKDADFGDYDENYVGGGLCGSGNTGRDNTWAEDCLVTNCTAWTGGGARFVNAVRCRFFGNRAVGNGGAAREANLFGCVVDRSYSGTSANNAAFASFTKCYNCTLGPHNYTLDGQTETRAISGASSKYSRLNNTLVLGKAGNQGQAANPTNCVFARGVTGFVTDACRVASDPDEVPVDGDLRPVAGRNLAVDWASEDPALSPELDPEFDLSGFARVTNGRMDVGALEADWSSRYAKDLSKKKDFRIVEASRGVVDPGSGTLVIAPGESVTAEWDCHGRESDYEIRFWVEGSGVMTLTVDGTTTEYPAAAHEYRVTVRGDGGAADRFAFSYDGADGFAELIGVRRLTGLLLLIDGHGGSAPGPAPRPQEVRVSRDFGYDPSDATRFIQRALDSGAARVVLDRVDGGNWNTRTLYLRSNTEFVVEPETELVAKRGAFQGLRDYLFVVDGVENVAIRGGTGSTFRMWKEDYQGPDYEHGEWRYALRLHNCTNAVVEGLRICEAGGDGIGVSGKDITIRNCVCDNNHRQGISVFSVENLLIEGCVLSNTKGTAPQAGIDFEPDRNGWNMSGVVMRNCLFENNTGTGIDIYLDKLRADATPVSMRFENCRTVGNSSSVSVNPGARAGDHVGGTIEFVGCSFESSRGNGVVLKNKTADAFDVSFSDCVVSNATDTSVVCSIAGDDLPGQPDGIGFGDLTVFLNADKPWFKLTTQGFGPAPTRLSGEVTVVAPDGACHVETIDADWIAANIRLVNGGEIPLPRVTYPSAASVTAVDACPGELVDLTPLQNVSSSRQYVFLLGEGGGEAKFVARQVIAAAGNELSTDQLTIAPLVGGKKADTVRLDIPGTNATELAFSATKGGFYVLKVPETETRFVIERTSVPIAIDNTKSKITLAGGTKDGKRQPFDLWFHTPGDVAFQVVVRGSDYYRFKTSVADPQGTVRFSRDLVEDTQMYVPEGTVPEGLWRIGFEKAAKAHYDWIGVDLLGIPGLLFLTPDKYWR